MTGAKSLASVLKLAAEVRQGRFDAVIYLMPSGRTQRQLRRDRLFFRLAGIRRILGFKYFETNKTGDSSISRVSEREFLLNSLTFIDSPSNEIGRKTDLLLTDAEIGQADQWCEKIAGTMELESRALLAVAPGGKRPSRIWDEKRFAEVVGRLVKHNGMFPIVFGGPEDTEKCDRLIEKWQTGLNAAGRLTVRESAALLRKCALYLGNDTGTMHLASAVGVPCVAIFSAADRDGQWAPFGNNNRLLRKRVECEGCGLEICCYKNMCLELISTDEVYAACMDILENGEFEERPEVEYRTAI